MSELFCAIRKKWVAATPEEKVRQTLLLYMTQHLGYSLASLSLEVQLNQLPHLRHVSPQEIPCRRADLIVLAKDIHPHFALYPLLLLECKATQLTPYALRQVMGYNQHLGAPFIGLANHQERQIGWHDPQQSHFHLLKELPPYSFLIQQLEKIK